MNGASNGRVIVGNRDTGAWRERFRDGISAISHEAACEATVVAYVVWKSCDWKATFIKRKCGWLIIATSEKIVEDDCANCNSI